MPHCLSVHPSFLNLSRKSLYHMSTHIRFMYTIIPYKSNWHL